MFLLRRSLRNFNGVFLRSLDSAYRIDERQIKRWVAPTLRELKRRRDKIGPEKPTPRSSFLEWNYEAELFAFSKRLGENFNRDVLKTALKHKSYVNNMKQLEGNSSNIEDNEAFIVEGSNIINDYVLKRFDKIYLEDAKMAVLKHLTSEDMLAHVAKHLGLTDLILTSEFPVEKSTLSNTFKAIIAALKHSDSLERSQKFVEDLLVVQLNGKSVFDIWEPESPIDFLNSHLKSDGSGELEARLCNESASGTILANYQVGLYLNKKLLGIGWGENVDIAKNTAALDAIRRMNKLRDVFL